MKCKVCDEEVKKLGFFSSKDGESKNIFVMCPECGHADTRLVEEKTTG